MAIIRHSHPRTDNAEIIHLIQTELMPLSHTIDPRDHRQIRELPLRLRDGVTFVISETRWSKPLGFVHLYLTGDTLLFDLLAIHPDHRGKQWGKALMMYGEAYGRSRQCTKGLLYFDEGNHTAYRLYSKLGYAVASHFPAMRCYSMEKSFSSCAEEPAFHAPMSLLPNLQKRLYRKQHWNPH
ncbi:GNAT family N-acetyltransferase [Paenibacillus sp. GCM10027626]|uniref:GNAT family N-acetyltransferase n=1 Tax=Paenibacillus sp. GCM10027626 TaxID=3273411 RepID=UPI00363580F1